MGRLEWHGDKVFWKIDYFNEELSEGSAFGQLPQGDDGDVGRGVLRDSPGALCFRAIFVALLLDFYFFQHFRSETLIFYICFY